MATSEAREVLLPSEMRTRRADWRNVVISALSGGLVFLVVDVGERAIVDPTNTWTTPRHIAALLIGDHTIGPVGSFDAGIVALALVLHAMFSLVYGMLLALAVRRLPLFPAIVGGVLFGSALYLINYYLLAGLFTSFAALRGSIAVAAHLAFGITTVVVYAALRRGSGRAGQASRVSPSAEAGARPMGTSRASSLP